MASLEICGGTGLFGDVKIQGSKNAALPILSACILARGVTKLYNCPHIMDVYNMIKILKDMGCHTEVCDDCIVIDTSPELTGIISEEDACTMRSSVMLMGAVLGRMHYVTLPWPGGCSIGERPVNIHLDALEKMNVLVTSNADGIVCETSGMIGNDITFPFPSVGATENVILAAVLATGTTTIHQAAKEPEIVDLCLFLNQMGAQIHGMGTSHIVIHGVSKLESVSYTVMADRIVAGTYLAAAAATGGNIVIYDIAEKDLRSTLNALANMGCGIVVLKNKIRLIAPQFILPVESMYTQPFPGFPTDMQSQLMACLTTARGESVIYENIFEDRFKIVPELRKMGADVLTDKNKAVIHGVQKLHGANVKALDLRGGAALVIAGLMAEGDTLVEGSIYIERGYQDICSDLAGLGANIHRK